MASSRIGFCSKTGPSCGKESCHHIKTHAGRSAIWQFSFRRGNAGADQPAPKRQGNLDGDCGGPDCRRGQRRVVFPRLASIASTRALYVRIERVAGFHRPLRFTSTAPSANSAALVTPSLTPLATPDAPSAGRKANSASAMSVGPAPVSSPAQGRVQATAITERIPKSGSSNDLSKGETKSAETDEAVEPEIKRPSLGQIRLAKHKVRRSASVQANGEMEPAL